MPWAGGKSYSDILEEIAFMQPTSVRGGRGRVRPLGQV